MLSKILIGIAIVVVILVVVVAMQPAAFRVSRTAVLRAPAAAVFAQVNDFHKWEAWSPWAKIDPAMKETFEGAPAGVGAVYFWAGNSKVGAGRMEILESRPNELIRIRLDFIKPFKSTNTAEFTFVPEDDATRVTWTMEGKNNFVAKAMGLFMSMDTMIGGQFEQGLAQLGTAAVATQ
ncbi:MAG: SRPBCC family protein [Opitutaceae bacterium]